MSSRIAAPLFALSLLTMSGFAAADEASDAFAKAQAADQALDFATALREYRHALELSPSAGFAIRARVRGDDLAAHSEGDFQPLTKLERVRRDPHLASDPAALSQLNDDAIAFPRGRVKGEALLLVAEGFGRRLKIPAKSIAPAEAVARDPSVDRVLRSEALTIACDDLVALGENARAYRLARDLRSVSPYPMKRFETEGRRDELRVAASVGLGAVVAAGIAAAIVVARRSGAKALLAELRAPASLLVALTIALGGAWLAHLYDSTVTLKPFYLLGAGVLLVERSCAVTARAFRGSPARFVAVLGGAVGIVSAALLALVVSDPSFIKSFGL